VKPNKEEIEAMLAMRDKELSYLKDELDKIAVIEDDEQLVEAARMVITRGRADAVCVSLGKAGAMLVTADHVEFMRGMTVSIV
jgi:fructose-1-phosphate kinase PfkB-like protein